jgi:hypothetical protein
MLCDPRHVLPAGPASIAVERALDAVDFAGPWPKKRRRPLQETRARNGGRAENALRDMAWLRPDRSHGRMQPAQNFIPCASDAAVQFFPVFRPIRSHNPRQKA